MSANRVLAAAVAAALISPMAMAQTESAEAPSGPLEEVVVTAQKREELAQKTAISMSVYTGDEIAASGVFSVASLASVDPSLNMTSANGAGYMAVRGVASTDFTEIGDPAVSISRDGFFTNRSYGLFSSLYDVERIEVLKGPQGTLQGRNTTGGAVNIITRRPQPELGGYVAAEAGEFSALNFEGALNIPLGDKVQLRVSGLVREHDGYRDNQPVQQKGDDEDAQSIRVALAFEPFENFTGLVSAQYDSVDAVGDVAAKGPYGQVTAWDEDSSRTFPLYQPYFTDMTDKRFRWEFNYSGLPAGMAITYLGGYDDVTWKHALDATADPNVVQQQFLQEENPTTQNHELRLSGGVDSPLFWQVGLFYFKEKNDPLDSGLILRSGPFTDRYLIHFQYAVETESKAAFGQIAWNVTDALKLSAGMRYTEDSKVRTGQADLDLQVASGGFLPPIIITTPGNGDIDDSKPTYHAGIDWQWTDQNLLYLKYDTGYKSGGFNSNGSAPSVPYGPETVEAVELGTKNRFAGDSVQLNLALFYQKYDGYQASQSTPVISSGSGVQNAGDADIYGMEGEIIWAFGNGGRINASATWLDTEFKEFDAVTPDGTQNVDLSGNELPNAPDLSVSAGLEYAFDMGPGTLTPRVDGKYTSTFNYDFYNNIDTRTPEATTVGNASLSYAPASNAWNLQAYVRNFTDEVVFARMYRNNVVNVQEYQFAPPRTYGVRFQYNF